jgi:hypothetical protein
LDKSTSEDGWLRRELIGSIAVAIVFVVVMCFVAVFWFGGLGAFLAYLCGEEIFLEPAYIRIAESNPNEEVGLSARLTNVSGRSIRLYGFETSCSCTLLDQLPKFLAAGSTAELEIKVHLPPLNGKFEGVVRVFTDSPTQDVLALRFDGIVRGAEPSTNSMASEVRLIELDPLPHNQ